MTQLTNERRQRERINLRCPVDVFVHGESSVRRATTVNISSRGLYCLSDSGYSPGDRLRCRIEIAPRRCQLGNDAVYLDCLVEVVRVERAANAYGIGCRIVRYMLTRDRSRDIIVKAAGATEVLLPM